MNLNAILFSIAGALFAIAIYRTGVLKFDGDFWINLAPQIAVAVVLAGILFWLGGMQLVGDGMNRAWTRGIDFVPMLIIMFITIGEASTLISLFKDTVISYLSGSRGFVGSAIAAYLTPGSLTSLPIVRDLWQTGAGHSQLVVFLIGSSMVNWQIFLMRAGMIGWHIALIQYASAVVFYTFIVLTVWGLTLLRV